jgi:hypothetical protein
LDAGAGLKVGNYAALPVAVMPALAGQRARGVSECCWDNQYGLGSAADLWLNPAV